MRQVLFLLSLTFLLSAQESACHRSAADIGAAGQTATEAKPSHYLLKKLRDKDMSKVRQLNAQAKIFVEGNGQSIAANANIIWIKDSVMWLNIKKFGIEIARVLITPDSVVTLNRLDKTCTLKSLASLQRQYNLPAGFSLLQQTLLASAWFSDGMNLESDLADGQHRLRGNDGQLGADYRLQGGSFLLSKESFVQQKDSRVVSLGFENYKKVPEAQWFPYLRNIDAFSPESGTMHLEIEFSDVEINVPKNFRFEIPTHYERVE